MILVIWILLVFPMFVVYDENEQTRVVACGLFYHMIDVFLNNKRGDN
nr:MAG TPA: hypothetical protein [Caudoviricetes sp.]